MSRVGGVGPAGVRIALLIRVKPVVAQVGSWLPAHHAWCDLRALARDAIGLVPPHPNHDHDHEGGDVKQRYENDQRGQAAAHFVSLLSATTDAYDDVVQVHGAIYVTSPPGLARGERRSSSPSVAPGRCPRVWPEPCPALCGECVTG